MELKDNPFLKQEDYAAGYRESVEALKNNPALLEFDKICYELFEMNPMGKRFLEIITERYLIPSIVAREANNYQLMVIWADGFKDFPRMIIQCVKSQAQRIQAGSKP